MSPTPSRPPSASQVELGAVVHWPTVFAAGALAVSAVAGLFVLLSYAGQRRPAPAAPAVAEAPPAPAALASEGAGPPRPPAAVPVVYRYALEREPRPARPAEPPRRVAAAPRREVPVAPPPAAEPTPGPAPRPAAVAAAPARRRGHDEAHLLDRLRVESVEVDLNAEKGAAEKLLASAKSNKHPLPDLVAARGDLRGLPLRQLSECQLGVGQAKGLQGLSRSIRLAQAARAQEVQDLESPGQQYERDMEFLKELEILKDKGREDTAPVFEQMLQADAKPVRLCLVKVLAASDGKRPTAALARLAAFDLDAEVRGAAATALKDRPKAESRPVLLAALRYPWPPVADHAADALTELADRDAAADLVGLLDRPDPRAPRLTADEKWVVPQLVRVNHLCNCLLCHAPSAARTDPVRAPVPTPGKKLPVAYYDRSNGPTVRADVTYLRQDFSALQPVDDADPWPRMQRFDYLIRLRELTAEEQREAPRAAAEGLTRGYPQREAVLAALRGVTGKDAGRRREDWERVLARR